MTGIFLFELLLQIPFGCRFPKRNGQQQLMERLRCQKRENFDGKSQKLTRNDWEESALKLKGGFGLITCTCDY
jgi:hypothetical protein